MSARQNARPFAGKLPPGVPPLTDRPAPAPMPALPASPPFSIGVSCQTRVEIGLAPRHWRVGFAAISFHPVAAHPRVAAVIIEGVCGTWGIARAELLGRTRQQYVASARLAAYLLTREFTNWPVARIADVFRRDHASICHGIQATRHRVEVEPLFRELVETARATVAAQLRAGAPANGGRS